MEQQFQSPAVDQLMLALMGVHKEFGVIIDKDKSGNRAKYASLPAILSSIHKICSPNGLILTQASRVIDGKLAIETILRHPASNQWISCQSLLTANPDAQSYDQSWGGSSTYHRRYDAMMLLGVFASDDPTDNDGDHAPTSPKGISEKQVNLLRVKLNGNKELEKAILAKLGIETITYIQQSKFNDVLEYVERSLIKR